MDFKEFNYSSLEQVKNDAVSLGLNLPFSENLAVLSQRVRVNDFEIPNSLAFNPMEGSDGEADGSPGELTVRRYERFAKGGAGLIWFEAVAVTPVGKASPRQLCINRNNLPAFKSLADKIYADARNANGTDFKPLLIMQLTHSGRYSKPEGKPAPIIACRNPILDPRQNIVDDSCIISDDDLERLEDKFVEAAVLAKEAGFHGVDVKSCHRYLNSELLSAHTRKGCYGETFEGRTRFIRNIFDKIRSRLGKDFIIATRSNIYDGIPYPYGWGVDREDYRKPDYSEPLKLVGQLYEKGMRLMNITMGTPYYNPHVNRPYDKGGYIPPEHQLEGVARLINGTAEIQKAFSDLAVVGTGYSWLRQFSANLAAGCKEAGMVAIAAYGRDGFAYPDFARDILENGGMSKEKCCIACGKCADILRAGGTTGCVIRDSKVYGPAYTKSCKNS